jgi:hypothetical protein
MEGRVYIGRRVLYKWDGNWQARFPLAVAAIVEAYGSFGTALRTDGVSRESF